MPAKENDEKVTQQHINVLTGRNDPYADYLDKLDKLINKFKTAHKFHLSSSLLNN